MQSFNPSEEFRRLLSLFNNGTRIELVAYAGGGLGILRNGNNVGFWAESAEAECVKAFYAEGTLDRQSCVVMSRATFEMTNAIAVNAMRNSCKDCRTATESHFGCSL